MIAGVILALQCTMLIALHAGYPKNALQSKSMISSVKQAHIILSGHAVFNCYGLYMRSTTLSSPRPLPPLIIFKPPPPLSSLLLTPLPCPGPFPPQHTQCRPASRSTYAYCLLVCRFATAYQGKYSDSINQAFVYPSSNFLDDIAWGAIWLYQRTGEQQFLTVRPTHGHIAHHTPPQFQSHCLVEPSTGP